MEVERLASYALNADDGPLLWRSIRCTAIYLTP